MAINMAKFHEAVNECVDQMVSYYGVERLHNDNEYFVCTLNTYSSDGKLYDRTSHRTHVSDMNDVCSDAEKYKWNIQFNKEEKTFTLEKHFGNGMYRIATYVPIDKDAIEINIED